MACVEEFNRKAEELVSALKAHGRLFVQSSKAEVSVGQFEELLTEDVLKPLTALPHVLDFAGGQHLSLTQARTLDESGLLDALISILSRLNFRQFSSHLDALATRNTGFTLANVSLDCILVALSARWRVWPPSDMHLARREVFSRCSCCISQVSSIQAG